MTLTIKEQFCGPPGTGNGGYVCGLLAKSLGTWPVEITLRKPVPLTTELEVRKDGEGMALFLRDEVLATARAAGLDLDVLEPPTRTEAREASKGFLGFHQLEHPYERCFVCGPARKAGDGIRIFAGPLKNGGGAATVWTPEDWQADDDGNIGTAFVLGALDCPGYFSQFPDANQHALLGRMTAEIITPLKAGEDYIVYGWPVAVEGRKHFVGTALYGAGGVCAARAISIWFPV